MTEVQAHRPLRWRPHPWLWLVAAAGWLEERAGDVWWRLRGHHHWYVPVAVSHWGGNPYLAAAGVPAGMPRTVVVYRCYCHGPQQHLTKIIPGRFTLEQLTTDPHAVAVGASVAAEPAVS